MRPVSCGVEVGEAGVDLRFRRCVCETMLLVEKVEKEDTIRFAPFSRKE